MKYTKLNNTTHIVEVSPIDFKIILNDSKKKSAFTKNYCNAGFFANFSENGQPFTLPVAHLVCDYDSSSQYTKKYCKERGKFNGDKFTFDSSLWSYNNSFYKKSISTLLINTNSNKAEIKEVISLPAGYAYAISGIPIMRNGSFIHFEKDVQVQGWDNSSLYGTWHIFVGLKKNSNNIYIIGMQTSTWNMVKTNEAYKKFKELGMYDVIKLDGGGSFHMNVDGKTVASTYEDRRINTIICFKESTPIRSEETNNETKLNDSVGDINNNNKNDTNNTKTETIQKTNIKKLSHIVSPFLTQKDKNKKITRLYKE